MICHRLSCQFKSLFVYGRPPVEHYAGLYAELGRQVVVGYKLDIEVLKIVEVHLVPVYIAQRFMLYPVYNA